MSAFGSNAGATAPAYGTAAAFGAAGLPNPSLAHAPAAQAGFAPALAGVGPLGSFGSTSQAGPVSSQNMTQHPSHFAPMQVQAPGIAGMFGKTQPATEAQMQQAYGQSVAGRMAQASGAGLQSMSPYGGSGYGLVAQHVNETGPQVDIRGESAYGGGATGTSGPIGHQGMATATHGGGTQSANPADQGFANPADAFGGGGGGSSGTSGQSTAAHGGGTTSANPADIAGGHAMGGGGGGGGGGK